MSISRLITSVTAALICLVATTVSGQDFPNKPIRIITAGAGGGADFTTRLIAQGISGPLGQSVIVDNRTGSLIAAEAVAKAPPDGYVLTVQGAVHWIYPLLYKAPYDAVKDFSPISLLAREVLVLAVHPSVPAKTVKELIALAKARPGDLNYASGQIGSPPHLASELFKSMAGVNIVRINYKGTGPALIDLIAGQVQMALAPASSIMPFVKSGRLRPLAVTSVTPSALAPGLPTIAASGLPGYESIQRYGIFAPAKTPEVIVDRLNQR